MKPLTGYCSALALAAVLTTGSAHAHNHVQTGTSSWDGPYVGVTLGYTDFTMEFRGRDDFGSVRSDFGGSGANYGILAGWGFTHGQGYLAFEANFGSSAADSTMSVDGDRIKIDQEESYGLSMLGGGFVADWLLLYGRLGWQRTNYEASVSGAGSDDEDFDGVRAGLGADMRYNDNLSLRIEYNRIYYSSERFRAGNARTSFEPEEARFELSAIMRF
ncbi:porin family protein [Methylonatrum kenyense]|uniref:porin family protein n=1 Tax=Methylonatrum kenyense TaxID=455253 RepID=UPI0020BE6BC8|nr:porin family protein [Methylonatrum kenyense]MCK8517080.1 porin family protein [Methylonatrum kenyense]